MIIFLLIILGAIAAYLLIIFPVWMMIKCARAQTPLIWKAVWLGVMLCSLGLGSYFYAFFGSEDINDRMTASVIFTVILFSYLSILPMQFHSMEYTKKSLLFQIRQVERKDLPRMDPAYAKPFRQNLDILKHEIEYCHFWEIGKQIRSSVLVLGLTQMLIDGEFTLPEYMRWTDTFENRDDFSLRKHAGKFAKIRAWLSHILGRGRTSRLTSRNVAATLAPDPDYPFIGFWKEDCAQDYGLAIDRAGGWFYSVRFCGPDGCLQPQEDRFNTTITADPDYEIRDANTLRIKGAWGWETYHRCPPR